MYWPQSISFKLTPEEDKAETHAKEIRTDAAVVAVLSKVAGIFTLKEGHGTAQGLLTCLMLPLVKYILLKYMCTVFILLISFFFFNNWT